MAAFGKGFGCRPGASGRLGIGPASESLPDLSRSIVCKRMAGIGKGFGCPPGASDRPRYRGPAPESLRRTNARESDERLAVYGDLTEPRLWRGMVCAGSLRAEGR